MNAELLSKIKVALWEGPINSSDDAIDVLEKVCKEQGAPKPTMKEVQDKLPWALGYSEAFEEASLEPSIFPDGSTMAHLDFTHALLHIMKATGKLAAMSENADHNRREGQETNPSARITNDLPDTRSTDFPQADCEKLCADLVICAMRLANVRPGGTFDLWSAVLRRIDDKNGSELSKEVS